MDSMELAKWAAVILFFVGLGVAKALGIKNKRWYIFKHDKRKAKERGEV